MPTGLREEIGYAVPELAGDIREWDRQPEETPQAFLAFTIYRDMGPARSIRAAWKIHAPHNKGIQGGGNFFNWSRKNGWKERAGAFDQFMQAKRVEIKRELSSIESARVADNQTRFRDGEVFLARQAFAKAKEILAIPLVRNSFVEQRDGKTIIHKATLITPAYYFAAAALMKAGSDLGRKGLGLLDEDVQGVTVDAFKRVFYKNTGEAAQDFPQGALPALVENAAVKPEIHLPSDTAGATPAADQDASGAIPAAGGGNGAAAMNRFKPPRERP